MKSYIKISLYILSGILLALILINIIFLDIKTYQYEVNVKSEAVGFNTDNDKLYFGAIDRNGLSKRPLRIEAMPSNSKVYIKSYGDLSNGILLSENNFKLMRGEVKELEVAMDLENIKPGDLLFFHGERGFYNKKFPEGIGHVALYTGSDKTIHAASERIQKNPEVVERGEVEERDLDYIIKKCKPLIVIKRIIR